MPLQVLCLILLMVTQPSSATVTTEEARAIARLYSAAFDREPKPPGLNFWIDALERGQTLHQIAGKFQESPEFTTRYGDLDNEGFVRQLYRNVLGREGKESGVEFWVEHLAAGAPFAQVLEEFADSPENRSKTEDLFLDMHVASDGQWTYDPVSGPVNSTGIINAFGSIFVNGVEFETGGAEIWVDGEIATEQALRLGMVVTVEGIVDADGITGAASRVFFDDEVQGPIASIDPGQDGDSQLLVILGVDVLVERVGTVFDDVSFDALAVGDIVEVSGFLEQQLLRATRVEKKTDEDADSSEVELKGAVSKLMDSEFSLGGVPVDFSNADLSDLPGGTVVEGMLVEVHGRLASDRIVADRVEEEDNIEDILDDDEEVSVEGAITQYVSVAQFQVNGVAVDASSAVLRPAGLELANGVIVEAEGSWNGSVLEARKVESRRGRIEVEASVASASADHNTVTLQLVGGTVTVLVDANTLLEDDTDQVDPLTLDDITPGDFLEVEAIQQNGRGPVATRIDRDNADDDILQAPVQSFNPGVDITLLGITYATAGAQFEGRGDEQISSEMFYSQLRVGDLVKVKDEQLADGVADEVEFEHGDALDGEEFNDRCDDNSESDDDCGADDDSDSDDDDEDDSGDDDDSDDDG